MWHHSLVVLLAFTTAIPTDVVQAAMTREQLKKIVDDTLEKIKQYGPIIIKLIAPFVAKKLVELGVIHVGKMIGSSIGKREANEETEVEAAERYLLEKFNSAMDAMKEEFHERIDMEAVNDQIEDWKETVSALAKAAKDKIFEFLHELGEFDFQGYVETVVDSLFGKRSVDKRSVIRTNWDQDTLNNYDDMLQELRMVLKKKFGEIPKLVD